MGVGGWGGGGDQNFITQGLRFQAGSCLFLQSVPANLHAKMLHIKQ